MLGVPEDVEAAQPTGENQGREHQEKHGPDEKIVFPARPRWLLLEEAVGHEVLLDCF
jgi:hypothetical protein